MSVTPPLLSARSLSFGYGRGAPVLSEWSVDIRAGELVALTGPSGRGKSTLLYVLGLMMRPRSGQVILASEPVSGLPDRERARLRAHEYGFVFQDAALDASRSVLDNILETSLYRGEAPDGWTDRASELLRAFGVDVDPRRRPGEVSGGQAQRIALCRALLTRPRIVLADEPTGNLDPGSARIVVDALRAHVTAGNAAIVATHDRGVADECDRVIAL